MPAPETVVAFAHAGDIDNLHLGLFGGFWDRLLGEQACRCRKAGGAEQNYCEEFQERFHLRLPLEIHVGSVAGRNQGRRDDSG